MTDDRGASLRDKAAIAGVGNTNYAALRAPDPTRTSYRVGTEAFQAALVDAGLRKDDIDGMVRLVRDFRKVPDIEKAIDIWSRADVEIDHLIALATRIDQAVQSGNSSEKAMLPYLDELHTLNQRLTPLEDAFSCLRRNPGSIVPHPDLDFVVWPVLAADCHVALVPAIFDPIIDNIEKNLLKPIGVCPRA